MICNLVPRPTLDQYPSRTSLSSSSVSTLSSSTSPSSSSTPSPSTSQPILFAFDHCFQVKGHGTVFTGTVLKGSIRVNDTICLPMQNEIRTVKSLQIFRRPAQLAVKGDRVGVCVRNLDPKGIERGILAAPGSVPTFSLALARVDKVRFFTGKIATGSKIHLTIGAHATVVATVACVLGTNDGLGLPSQAAALQALVAGIVSSGEEGDFTSQSSLKSTNDEERHTFSALDINQNYVWQDELYGLEGRPISNSYRLQQTAQLAAEQLVRERVEQLSISKAKKNKMNKKAAMGKDHSANNNSEADDNVNPGNINAQEDETSSQYRHWGPQWILFRFPQPVTAPADAMVIGAKLDVDLGSYGAVSNKSGGGNSKNNYKPGDTSSNKPSGEEKEWSSASDATACRFALYGRIVRIIAEDESTASGIKSGGVPCIKNSNNNNKCVNDSGSGSKSSSTTALFNSVPTFSLIPLSQIKVFKEKIREGSLERILGDSGSISLSNSSAKEDDQSFEAYIGPGVEAIGTGMFKKETDLEIFIGMKVFTGLAEEGEIIGKFGKSSKFRVHFPKGLIAPIDGRSAFARNLYLVAKRKVPLAVGGLGKGAPGSGGSDPKIQLLQFI
uniref:Selenocysteine-specific elongation factor n=1 Tax=Polytomella parva TaxID=51329 RepID=A0A7S0VU48_9CHLO|mmetsp:Transcript_8731/g.16568  ORF Transcript_8731/g.16568 Transcript_8731/m.16568 type:complete len:613 (+) Transcript_8731:71-1909(+)